MRRYGDLLHNLLKNRFIERCDGFGQFCKNSVQPSQSAQNTVIILFSQKAAAFTAQTVYHASYSVTLLGIFRCPQDTFALTLPRLR